MRYLPIKFHVFYILFTFLFSVFGPVKYSDYNTLNVSLYILAYLIIVTTGFALGTRSKLFFEKKKTINIVSVFKVSIYISIFLYIIYMYYLYTIGMLNFNLLNMGQSYIDYYDYYYEKKSNSAFTFELFFIVAASIFKFLALTLGFYYFKLMNRKLKILFILLIIFIITTQTFSLGNQKSIGDIFIFMLISLIIGLNEMNKKEKFRTFSKIIFVFIFVLALFSYSQYDRLMKRDIDLSLINNRVSDYKTFDQDHLFYKVFGNNVGFGLSYFISGYLSGGYYGLSKSMELPFEWTYGIGNSVAISSIVQKYSGNNIYAKTYLNRIEQVYNIPGKSHWHTIFPWLASDFTFGGTLFIFLFISYYYGKSWREILERKNPISLLLFSILTVLFVFVPANNQIMHGYDYFMITFFVFFIYFRFHNRYNRVLQAK